MIVNAIPERKKTKDDCQTTFVCSGAVDPQLSAIKLKAVQIPHRRQRRLLILVLAESISFRFPALSVVDEAKTQHFPGGAKDFLRKVES